MRTIDADTVIMALRLEYPMIPMFKESRKEWEIKTDGYRKAEEIINEAPTIDAVSVVHGKWKRKIVDNGFNSDWVCSKCGYRVMTDFVSYSYCPNCGADMRGEQDE